MGSVTGRKCRLLHWRKGQGTRGGEGEGGAMVGDTEGEEEEEERWGQGCRRGGGGADARNTNT